MSVPGAQAEARRVAKDTYSFYKETSIGACFGRNESEAVLRLMANIQRWCESAATSCKKCEESDATQSHAEAYYAYCKAGKAQN